MMSDSNSNERKKGGVDPRMRTKLVSESIAPWRTLRLFLYAALGSGAFIGGLVNLSGFMGSIASGQDIDVNTEVGNVFY